MKTHFFLFLTLVDKKYDYLLVKISGGDDDKASIISKINDNLPKPEETVPIMAQQYMDPDIQEPFQPGSTPVHLESRLGNFFCQITIF